MSELARMKIKGWFRQRRLTWYSPRGRWLHYCRWSLFGEGDVRNKAMNSTMHAKDRLYKRFEWGTRSFPLHFCFRNPSRETRVRGLKLWGHGTIGSTFIPYDSYTFLELSTNILELQKTFDDSKWQNFWRCYPLLEQLVWQDENNTLSLWLLWPRWVVLQNAARTTLHNEMKGYFWMSSSPSHTVVLPSTGAEAPVLSAVIMGRNGNK